MMPKGSRVVLILLPAVVAGCGPSPARVVDVDRYDPHSDVQELSLSGNDVVEINANPEKGFNFPYYLFIPDGIGSDKPVYLLVEPNNTGQSTDDFEVHRQKAERLARESYANRLARRLRVPLLVPAFPRPRKDWQIYTHSLDRDTLEVKQGKLRRIDLQLVAMIRHAQQLLRADGVKIQSRVFLHGFSASGNFTNRFAFLHPKLVKAVASGGVNAIPTLPVARWNGHELPFPIGIADLESIAGAAFDEPAYRRIAQYIYMGYLDKNDTVPYRDAWSESEAALIRKAVATEMMPDRWEVSRRIYQQRQLPVQCVTYNGVGHTIKKEMLEDIAEFFEANSGDEYVRIKPHVYPFVEYREIYEAHVNGIYWRGDDHLPDFVQGKLQESVAFVIGIEEWIEGQDHRQLLIWP